PEKISWEGGKSGTSPKWIVVLGGGHVSDPRLPSNSQISAPTLGRVVEGVRLHKAVPGSKLLLSGGAVFDPVPEAEVMSQIAVLLGVKPQDIMLESDSRDTGDQADIIAKKIGREKFILVTSAAHMPRSMALFRRRGLEPIPAPADFRAPNTQSSGPAAFFPDVGSLGQTQIAVHEYLGLAWAWLRGAI
ncbi:MAG: ElyC/SanA/YdcF family protein, partial [Deltaproteobacteria bacterium]|nr:ElyC/SanA/YdcF family protein [Deltaproteobacteria bacterium]